MRREYDFTKSVRNPYARRLKAQVTIRIDKDALAYFRRLAAEIGMPYQSLINFYLRDCMASKRRLGLEWRKATE
jgi:uncharacterized protein (DUF4415 family)